MRLKIQYAKSELRSYNFMKRELKRIDNEIIEVMTKLEDVKTILPSDSVGGTQDPYKKARLYDRLDVLEIEKNVITHRIKRVDRFMASLDPKDAIALKYIYINDRRTIEDIAIHNGYAKNTLVRHIDEVLRTF